MVSKSVFAAAALVAVARAQSVETSSASSVAASSTVAQSMPPVATAAFNPAPIASNLKLDWCRAQLVACPQICGGSASTNRCDEVALTYNCICANGTVPDVTGYANTLPFFICQATYAQCIAAHPDDSVGQQTCTNNQQCGTRNATAEALAAISSSAAETSSAAATSGTATSTGASEAGTGSASGSAATASDTGNAASTNTQHIATGAFAALLMAACKLFL